MVSIPRKRKKKKEKKLDLIIRPTPSIKNGIY
jgi:hypothetical protein